MSVRDVDVDAQHLPEQLNRVLRAVLRIVAGAAVAHPDVEISIRTECEVAAVVIRVRLPDDGWSPGASPSQVEARRRIRHDGAGRPPESRDDGVARGIGEVHEQPAAGRVGGEGEAEQAALAAAGNDGRHIEEIARQHHAAADDANVAVLLDDELDRTVGGILNECKRRGKTGRVHTRVKLGVDVSQQATDDEHKHHRPLRAHACIVARKCQAIFTVWFRASSSPSRRSRARRMRRSPRG
jgi:hypothetical protein